MWVLFMPSSNSMVPACRLTQNRHNTGACCVTPCEYALSTHSPAEMSQSHTLADICMEAALQRFTREPHAARQHVARFTSSAEEAVGEAAVSRGLASEDVGRAREEEQRWKDNTAIPRLVGRRLQKRRAALQHCRSVYPSSTRFLHGHSSVGWGFKNACSTRILSQFHGCSVA